MVSYEHYVGLEYVLNPRLFISSIKTTYSNRIIQSPNIYSRVTSLFIIASQLTVRDFAYLFLRIILESFCCNNKNSQVDETHWYTNIYLTAIFLKTQYIFHLLLIECTWNNTKMILKRKLRGLYSCV